MIHLKFLFRNIIIIEKSLKNIGNFPEKYTGNFRKFYGKI